MLNFDPGIPTNACLTGNAVSDGFTSPSGKADPIWKKNDCKIYIVAYPSDTTSSYFQADWSTPTVHSAGAGYGIFVEPKRVSRARFWKEKGGEPTLFTIEGGGPAPGVTVREGVRWGINGMLVRFLMDSRYDAGKVTEVYETLDRVTRRMHIKQGGEVWLREALIALIEAGLIRRFDVQEFIDLAGHVVKQQLKRGASWDRVVTLYYEDHIVKHSGYRA